MNRLYNENQPDKDGKEEPYEETLIELYEYLFELENNKPVGASPSWDKKYRYYKDKIRDFDYTKK